ncbi:uncharacterized protein LOC142572095 [Dermacentor variabilis]|uniref:uncharacterized protein LOC142572095 n=1 Tax=Dermacentor variabilis TaxID=34621 RepID=UPI003F5BC68C
MYNGTLLYETLRAPRRQQYITADILVDTTHGERTGDNTPNASVFYEKAQDPEVRQTRLDTNTLQVLSAFLMASELSSPAIQNIRGEDELLDMGLFPAPTSSSPDHLESRHC